MAKENKISEADLVRNLKESSQSKMKEVEKAIICPRCGKALQRVTLPGEGRFFMHEGRSNCKAKFKTTREIKEAEKEAKETEEKKEINENASSKDTGFKEPEIIGTITMDEYLEMEKSEVKKMIDDQISTSENEENQRTRDENLTADHIQKKPEVEKLKSPTRKIRSLNRTRLQMREMSERDMEKMKRAYIIREVKDNSGLDHFEKEDISKESQILPDEEDEDVYGKTQILSEKIEPEPEAGISFPTLTNISTGEIYEINRPIYRIGKNEKCDLRICENTAVSRKHAEILLKNGTSYVKDLSSTNGTFVGEFRIPTETEVEIKDEQIIKFANEEFRFKVNG